MAGLRGAGLDAMDLEVEVEVVVVATTLVDMEVGVATVVVGVATVVVGVATVEVGVAGEAMMEVGVTEDTVEVVGVATKEGVAVVEEEVGVAEAMEAVGVATTKVGVATVEGGVVVMVEVEEEEAMVEVAGEVEAMEGGVAGVVKNALYSKFGGEWGEGCGLGDSHTHRLTLCVCVLLLEVSLREGMGGRSGLLGRLTAPDKFNLCSHNWKNITIISATVEPPNKGHAWDQSFIERLSLYRRYF